MDSMTGIRDVSRRSPMNIRHILWVAALPALLCCSDHDRLVAAMPFNPSSLAGGTYNVVAKNPAESIILLGQLHFAPISGTDIQGTWDLKQWSGTDVPGLPGSGAMTGTLFGTAAILRLELPGTESTLGVVIDHAVDGRVAGRIDLLPSGTFHGRIEAIRATP
jgi:hypothetical protein